MRRVLLSITLLTATASLAQVELTTPLVLTGPEGQRAVHGLSDPSDPTALVNVGWAVSGEATWAQAAMVGDTVVLAQSLAGTVAEGQLLHFVLPVDLTPDLHIRYGNSPALPWRRGDDEPLPLGGLAAGTVCEVLHYGGRYLLTGPAFRSCPTQAIAVNDRFCIDVDEGAVTAMPEAVAICTAKGGRLCSWGEYVAACNTRPELTGMFNNWEWADDTANHTHTFGQVGRQTCMSQRSANASPNNHGAVRCCYTRP